MIEAGAIGLRPPDQVMRLSRMGAHHQTRLSFMRILIRRMRREKWEFIAPNWHIDARGTGHAVYSVNTGTRVYSLVAFAHDLPDEMRSDRVIATAWDATFTLFDGVPTAQDIAVLAKNVPQQEAGRMWHQTLCLSRANRSMRLWELVVGALSEGRQPDADALLATGYLMRTTAVYGSGKFGLSDRADIDERPEFIAPFQVEMLSVYLIRQFVFDLVDHMARQRGGAKAVALDPQLKRHLGIGNSTGLGMAPFLVNHPLLLNAWVMAREKAYRDVRRVQWAEQAVYERFKTAQDKLRRLCMGWDSAHPYQRAKIDGLLADLNQLDGVRDALAQADYPWERMRLWAEGALTVEGQEAVAALSMEPYPDMVDHYGDALSVPVSRPRDIDGQQSCGALLEFMKTDMRWALDTNFKEADAQARFWYVSEAKLEPRLGERDEEPGSELERPLTIARDMTALFIALTDHRDMQIADFLRAKPEHRYVLRRVQAAQTAPYSEIRDNLLSSDMMPVDMLRFKLAWFGASKFDPRSDRWLRIVMYQGAPLPEDLNKDCKWVLPAA